MNSVKSLHLFTTGEKLKVIHEAWEIDNRAAGGNYVIPGSPVHKSLGRRKKETLNSSNNSRRAFRSQILKFPETEELSPLTFKISASKCLLY